MGEQGIATTGYDTFIFKVVLEFGFIHTWKSLFLLPSKMVENVKKIKSVADKTSDFASKCVMVKLE